MAGFQITEVVEVGPGWNKVRLADGNVYTIDGPYNWRSNNPGNIEYGEFAKSQGAIGMGAVPPGRDRGFAIFPTYEDGRKAKETLLFTTSGYLNSTKGGYPEGTIGAAIHRYAPTSENNTEGYIKAITDALGVDANTRLLDLSSEQRATMLTAMEQVEGYRPGDILNEAGIRLPPMEVPNVVASQIDTTPQQTQRTFRYTNQDTGNLLGYEPQPLPAARAGLLSFLERGPDFKPTFLPELPASAPRLNSPVPQSTIERNPPREVPRTMSTAEIPQSIIERIVPRAEVRPTVLQSTIERAGPVGLLNRPAATPALTNGTDLGLLNRNDYTPYLTRSGSGVTDVANLALFGNTPDYLSIGSLPKIPMRSTTTTPQRPQSYAGQDNGPSYRPTTYAGQDRVTPTAPPTLTATNRPPSYVGQERTAVSTSDDTGSGAGSFSNFATLLGLRPSTIGQPPTTRTVPTTTVNAPAPTPVKTSIVASFPTTGQGITSSVLDNYRYGLETTPKPSFMTVQPAKPPTQTVPGQSFIERGPAITLPAKPATPAAPAKPTYTTVMRETTVENPAYTKWKAENLAAERKEIPLGDVMHFTSRDSVAQAAAGQNAAAKIFPPAPQQWITTTKPVQVAVPPKAVVPPPKPVVVPPPVVAPPVYQPPRIAPVPIMRPPAQQPGIFGNLLGSLGMLGGGQSQQPRPAVGTNLGIAGNGGVVTQGYNGLLNSLTQNSDHWQNATSGSDISNGPARAVVSKASAIPQKPVLPVKMVQALSAASRFGR